MEKFKLRFVPADEATRAEVCAAGKKQVLDLTLKSSKSWRSVFEYFLDKWSEVDALPSRLQIYFLDDAQSLSGNLVMQSGLNVLQSLQTHPILADRARARERDTHRQRGADREIGEGDKDLLIPLLYSLAPNLSLAVAVTDVYSETSPPIARTHPLPISVLHSDSTPSSQVSFADPRPFVALPGTTAVSPVPDAAAGSSRNVTFSAEHKTYGGAVGQKRQVSKSSTGSGKAKASRLLPTVQLDYAPVDYTSLLENIEPAAKKQILITEDSLFNALNDIDVSASMFGVPSQEVVNPVSINSNQAVTQNPHCQINASEHNTLSVMDGLSGMFSPTNSLAPYSMSLFDGTSDTHIDRMISTATAIDLNTDYHSLDMAEFSKLKQPVIEAAATSKSSECELIQESSEKKIGTFAHIFQDSRNSSPTKSLLAVVQSPASIAQSTSDVEASKQLKPKICVVEKVPLSSPVTSNRSRLISPVNVKSPGKSVRCLPHLAKLSRVGRSRPELRRINPTFVSSLPS